MDFEVHSQNGYVNFKLQSVVELIDLDQLGSSVFVVKSQNFKENKIKENASKKKYACKSCKDTKIKREKCILIKSTFLETNNISVASRKLGVSRTTIYKHLR